MNYLDNVWNFLFSLVMLPFLPTTQSSLFIIILFINFYLTRKDSEIKNLFRRSVLAKMGSNTSQDITTQTD